MRCWPLARTNAPLSSEPEADEPADDSDDELRELGLAPEVRGARLHAHGEGRMVDELHAARLHSACRRQWLARSCALLGQRL